MADSPESRKAQAGKGLSPMWDVLKRPVLLGFFRAWQGGGERQSVAAIFLMKRFSTSLVLLAAVVALCQCGVPQPPQCRMVPLGSRQPVAKLMDEAHDAWHVLRAHAPFGYTP